MGAVVARPQDTERRVETPTDDTFDNSPEISPDDRDSFGGEPPEWEEGMPRSSLTT